MANSKSICSQSEVCGGCTYQAVDYVEQLNNKFNAAREALLKNDIDEGILSEIIPSPEIYGYRNKMEYTFGDEVIGGPLNLGMHKAGSYISIIDASSCQLVPDDFNKILKLTRDWCVEKGYSFYHKKRHDGLLRSLVIRQGVRTNELLVNIVTSSFSDFAEEEYCNLLLSTELNSKIVGILHTINDNVSDALIVDDCHILYGRDHYFEEVLGLKFKVGAFSFFQSNVVAAERLYQAAMDSLPNLEGKIVYDLYCGTGTISQAMALRAKKVIGVEIVEEAATAAKINAQLNNLDNCDFICGDVLKVLDNITEKPDVIVVDPPRSGIHPKAMEKICAYNVPEILYISCNPKTLAINLKSCQELGYKPISLKCYDNFAFTAHTEAICLLKKI